MSGSTIGEGLYQMVETATSQVPVSQRLREIQIAAVHLGLTLALLVGLWPAGAAAQKRSAPSDRDLLATARALYNQQDLDGAIAAATKARLVVGAADAADLVLARARLERFRKTGDRTDLVAARDALVQIRPEGLAPQGRVELVVGLGEALYLDGQYGASAELFESALPRGEQGTAALKLDLPARERVLEWWATALDQEAQSRPAGYRAVTYVRILTFMQEELVRNPGSVPATYWVVAANRALGDLDGAWDAAIAGWVRAGLAGTQGAALREDLDRLVLQAVIPERVRLLADSDRERERIASEMRTEWEGIKRDWKRQQPLLFSYLDVLVAAGAGSSGA
jgi:hypothetical protein